MISADPLLGGALGEDLAELGELGLVELLVKVLQDPDLRFEAVELHHLFLDVADIVRALIHAVLRVKDRLHCLSKDVFSSRKTTFRLLNPQKFPSKTALNWFLRPDFNISALDPVHSIPKCALR